MDGELTPERLAFLRECVAEAKGGLCEWDPDDIEDLLDMLAESQALLALYSGGRAGVVPEGGWDVGGLRFVLSLGDRLVNVMDDGTWIGMEAGNDANDQEHPGPRSILQACAEAKAWLAKQEVAP